MQDPKSIDSASIAVDVGGIVGDSQRYAEEQFRVPGDRATLVDAGTRVDGAFQAESAVMGVTELQPIL